MTQLLPALSSAKEAALRDSIREFGVLVPIARARSANSALDGRLIDGHHRLRISQEEGKSCPEAPPIAVLDEEHFAQVVIEINDKRRHALTKEQRQQVHASLRGKGFSFRDIADVTGAGYGTVYADVQQAKERETGTEKSTDQIRSVEPSRITGHDGKSRPATRKPRAGKPKTEKQLQKEAEQQEVEQIREHVQGRGGAAVAPPLPPRKMRELRDRLHQRIVECIAVISEAQRAELDLGFAEFDTAKRLRKLSRQAEELARKVERIPSGNQENNVIDHVHGSDARHEAAAL